MADSSSMKKHNCLHCKLSCLEENGICCKKCYTWYHLNCANSSRMQSHILTNSSQNFKCNLCCTKSNCSSCNRKYFSRSLRLNCINCESSFCSKCISSLGLDMKFFLCPENDFYCPSCDENFSCIKCRKPCEDFEDSEPCILCDSCNRWLHFKCSRLTTKQFNKLGRNPDPYFCSSCVGESLPFSKISKKCFFEENAEKKIIPTSNCKLCIECNSECEFCVACPDPHKVCDRCSKCSLLDVESFSTLLNSKSENEILLTHINSRNLSEYIGKIQEFIDTLDVLPDIICISETKITQKTDLNFVQLDDYSFVHNDTATQYGGTGIYILKKYSFSCRKDLDINISGECEASFIELNLSQTKKSNSFIFGSIYRHPHDNHDEFYEALSDSMSKIDEKCPIILAGDMNINVSVQNPISQQYKNVILSVGLKNLVSNQFTRITDLTETTIDHILTNLNSNITDAGVVQLEIADHLPVFVKATLFEKQAYPKNKDVVYKRFFNDSKKDLFCETFVKNLSTYIQHSIYF